MNKWLGLQSKAPPLHFYVRWALMWLGMTCKDLKIRINDASYYWQTLLLRDKSSTP
jgi:hypothetical protein